MTNLRAKTGIRAWWERRKQRKRDEKFRRLGIPDDVRRRMEKLGIYDPPDWYAGRRVR